MPGMRTTSLRCSAGLYHEMIAHQQAPVRVFTLILNMHPAGLDRARSKVLYCRRPQYLSAFGHYVEDLAVDRAAAEIH